MNLLRNNVSLNGLEKVLLAELIQCGRLCYQRGWCYGTAGNFSIRLRDQIMWQSPSGLNKGNLKSDLFIPIYVEDGTVLDPLQSLTPSLEMPVHRGIYKAKSDAKAVIHCHPPFLVSRSQKKDGKLCFKDMEMIKALGAKDYQDVVECPVIKNLTKQEMLFIAEDLGRHLGVIPALILAGHGVYAWGSSPLEALAVVEAIEFCCQTESENGKS